MDMNAIWTRARADMTVSTDHGTTDPFLWEHALRVARNARFIASLPEVQQSSPDLSAIESAALYHDAGWIARLKDGEISREEFLIRPTTSAHYEQGAMLLEQRLMKILPPDTLVRASHAIRSMSDRNSRHIEGRILAEADNLDEFGIMALWGNIRRGLLDGRGVQSAVDTWRRRKEYRFWEARLNESFRLDKVRKIAEKRLQHYEHIMRELADLVVGRDVCLGEAALETKQVVE